MAETIPVSFVQGYTAEIHRLSAQRATKLRSAVRVKTGLRGKRYHFERLGASDLATITSRHMDTPILNPVHSRRAVTFTDKGGAILLDPLDELKMLIQPQNDYAMNHADSVNRVYDDLIITALTGNATSIDDVDASSNITLASLLSGTHVVANGGTGLTYDKVNQSVRLLNESEVAIEDRYAVVSPQGIEDLLATTQATSSDFTILNAIKTGMFPAGAIWMGYQWIMSTRLAVASLVRTCIFFQKNAIGLAIEQDIKIEIDRRPDKLNALQVLATVSAGAVRIEEEGVVSVDILES